MSYDIKNILYATDLGEYGPEVFRLAIALADRFEATIHILHVVDEPSYLTKNVSQRYLSSTVFDTYRASARNEALTEIEERLKRFSEDILENETPKNLHVGEIKVVPGKPGRTIVDEARRIGADCIVMGSRRYSALSAITIGSVAHEVTINARLPVFLYPI